MSLRRFLVPRLSKGEIGLPPEEARHASKVLRLRKGDEVVLLDGQGGTAPAKIISLGRDAVHCLAGEPRRSPRPVPRLVVCVGLLKAQAMELLAAKLSEMVVDEVRPLLLTRSAPRLKEPATRVQRWRRLAISAIKSSGNPFLPRILEPAALEDVLAGAPAPTAKILLYEEDQSQTLASLLPGLRDEKDIWVMLGPEGGFTYEEAAQAQEAGFAACHLPQVILRAGTAALAAVSVLRFGLDRGQKG